MTAPEPTAEHRDAVEVVRAIGREHRPALVSVERDSLTCACGHESTNNDGLEEHRATLIVAALAASLPAEVMLAALVDRGTLTEEFAYWDADESVYWTDDDPDVVRRNAAESGLPVVRRIVTRFEAPLDAHSTPERKR